MEDNARSEKAWSKVLFNGNSLRALGRIGAFAHGSGGDGARITRPVGRGDASVQDKREMVGHSAATSIGSPRPDPPRLREDDVVIPRPATDCAALFSNRRGSGNRHAVPFTRSGSTVSGDFTGTTASAGIGTGNDTARIAGGEVILFDGSVSACGSGGATLVVFAAGLLGGRLSGTWFVVDGQGTGDLNDLRGGGTLDTPPGGTTTFRGRVSCN
jgi:hypothetical protein